MSRWTKLAGDRNCKSASCPAVYLSDDGRLFVQGPRASEDERAELGLSAEEDAVEVSRTLFHEAAAVLREPDRGH